jgi:NADPH:quinone reductase-like Zn-dependent oxidoreductase
MKAMVRDRFGPPDVLEMREVPMPRIGAGEVLVRVHASSVSIGDWFWLTGTPRIMRPASGMLRPRDRTLGRDVAGVVESVGADVSDLAPGDEVYGETDWGTHAEYVAVDAGKLARKPSNLTFEQAAAVPLAGVAALQGLRDAGRLEAGARVLINGASGAVGTFAVQIARALGTEVTGVASTSGLELARSLGADHVIDHTRDDFTSTAGRYELIFDLAGNRPIRACRAALSSTGVYVASTSNIGTLLRAALMSRFSRGQVVVFAAKESRADLDALRDLIEVGSVKPVIERTYSLGDTPKAFRDQGVGHARGRKVIRVAA